MRVATKARCALAAMLDLALRAPAGPVVLLDISRRQQISMSHLEQLFSRMRQHELVQGVRGPGGGYSLAREPALITVADIIAAVDEPGEPAEPEGDLSQDLWSGLEAQMLEWLSATTLKVLVDEQLAKGRLRSEATLRNGIARWPVVKPIKVTGPNSVFALADYSRPHGL